MESITGDVFGRKLEGHYGGEKLMYRGWIYRTFKRGLEARDMALGENDDDFERL